MSMAGNMKVIMLLLTCAHQDEANKIAQSLLEKRLIACAKQMPITSLFRWQNAIENSQETLMLMDSMDTKFNAIETEVRRLHSYDTFVLVALEASHISSAAQQWIANEIQQSLE